MTIAEIVAHLLDGWPETIHYRIRIPLHQCPDDAGRRHCQNCPSVVEQRTETRLQAPLVTQLLESRWALPVAARDCEATGTKTKSKPPGNLLGPDEILGDLWFTAFGIADEWGLADIDIREAAVLRALATAEPYADPLIAVDAARALHKPWRRARLALGYDNETVQLEAPCRNCDSGRLYTERHQPTVVWCADCSHRYPANDWISMLEDVT